MPDDPSQADTEQRGASRSLVHNLRIVSLCTLLSRLLGLLRDILMAAVFGAGTTLDVFVIAFRLPNLSRQLFGEGALTAAFLPIFLRERSTNGDEAARSTLTAVAIALGSFLSISVILCEAVIAVCLIWIDLDPQFQLLLQLIAILLPYLVFICLAALVSAALHAIKVFLWPALVPVVLNVVWLTGIGIAVSTTTDESLRIRMIAGFLTLAGGMQMLLPWVVLTRKGFSLSSAWRSAWPKVGELLKTMLPIVAGVSIIQLNSVLDSLMAWGLSTSDLGDAAPAEWFGLPTLLESGTTTALYLGQRMYQFPVGVFGTALGTVLYPLLTQHAQSGETKRLQEDLTKGIRLVIAIAIPASAGLMFLSFPLTELLFQHGEFNSRDTALAAKMIAMYGAGVWTYIGIAILNRAFYAVGDRVTPVQLGMAALVLNIVLNIMLVFRLGGIGIALGSVLATTFQVSMSLRLFHRQQVRLDWQPLQTTLLKAVLATIVMIGCCWGAASFSPGGASLIVRFARLIIPLLAGIISYGVLARILKMNEIVEIFQRHKEIS